MEEYNQFIKKHRVKRFKRGEIILVQGEVPGCAFAVKSGLVKSYNLTVAGEEKPIGFDRAGEMFPIGWIANRLKHAQFYYEAYTEAEVYCVPRDEFIEFLANNPKAQAHALLSIVTRYVSMQMRVNALEQSKASQKVLNTIHYLCLRFGEPMRGGLMRIDLPLTQQDMANFIGLTRETTGIELKKLQKDGVVVRKKQQYLVKIDKLNDLLDEDYALGMVDPVEVKK